MKTKIKYYQCECCGKYTIKPNSVMRRSGVKYYCDDPDCQKAFNDDAGDPPDECFDE